MTNTSAAIVEKLITDTKPRLQGYADRESFRHYWVAVQITNNKLDGKRVYVLSGRKYSQLFDTRKQCREWIETNWGFLRTREDLKREPHCWTMPVPKKVKVVLRFV